MKIVNLFIRACLTSIVLLLAGNVYGGTYVSFKGGYYFNYPDEWEQVPYLTADMFFRRTEIGAEALDYEAVFAPKTSSPFFQTEYLIITTDSLEWLYDYQIDSVVEDMERSFGEDITFRPSWDAPTDLKSNSPVYDKENRIITVVNDIYSANKIAKRNLMVKKFYDKGIANFYFYAPDSLFAERRPVFVSIVNSFSTENVSEAVPEEEGKVSSAAQKEELNYRNMLIPIGAAILIALILVIRLKRAKRLKSQEQ